MARYTDTEKRKAVDLYLTEGADAAAARRRMPPPSPSTTGSDVTT